MSSKFIKIRIINFVKGILIENLDKEPVLPSSVSRWFGFCLEENKHIVVYFLMNGVLNELGPTSSISSYSSIVERVQSLLKQ